ncbi:MAG TPA: GDSL-type esterase/lipase family protein [Ilumatobacteraceae bacterium]|nr:GDSL-type esterase/lipase family protein [Ilumatobacteraceae bacterium]
MSPRPRRRTLLAIGALVLVAGGCTDDRNVEPLTRAATGTDPSGGDGSPDAPPETVAMIGDSITFMSTVPLQAELSGTGLDVLAIDAQVGRRITVGENGRPYPGTAIVEYIANSEPPDVWVIALGTNDIGQYPDTGEFAIQVYALLDLIPAAAPLVWIDTWDGDRLEETRLVNDTLRAVVGSRDNAVVVDWASHGDDAGVVTDDAVHPTEDGTAVFGQVVADGVESLLESL